MLARANSNHLSRSAGLQKPVARLRLASQEITMGAAKGFRAANNRLSAFINPPPTTYQIDESRYTQKDYDQFLPDIQKNMTGSNNVIDNPQKKLCAACLPILQNASNVHFETPNRGGDSSNNPKIKFSAIVNGKKETFEFKMLPNGNIKLTEGNRDLYNQLSNSHKSQIQKK